MPVGQIVGTFLVQQLAGNLTLALLVPGAIGLVGVLALAFVLPDRPPPVPAMAVVSGVPTPSSRSSLLAHRDFSWAWLSRVLFVTGTVFLQAYQPFLLIPVGDAADRCRLVVVAQPALALEVGGDVRHDSVAIRQAEVVVIAQGQGCRR